MLLFYGLLSTPGARKGIQWAGNSCAADSLMFMLFHSSNCVDEHFFGRTSDGDENVEMRAGLAHVVHQLRSTGFVSTEHKAHLMSTLRNVVHEHERVKPFTGQL